MVQQDSGCHPSVSSLRRESSTATERKDFDIQILLNPYSLGYDGKSQQVRPVARRVPSPPLTTQVDRNRSKTGFPPDPEHNVGKKTMVELARIGLGLITLLVSQTPSTEGPKNLTDRNSYEAASARAEASRDPNLHVQLALWCEAHGLTAERTQHLARAVLADPKNAAARGLLGLVEFAGTWNAPDQVSQKIKADAELSAKLAEYNARRERLDLESDTIAQKILDLERKGLLPQARLFEARNSPRLAPEHVKLGLWCEKNGLKTEAEAHFTAAVQLNPHDDPSWKHLGYIKHRGRWMTREQITAEEHEHLEQLHADRHWEPLLRKWKSWLHEKTRRDEAEKLLGALNDPKAIPSVVRVFLDSSPVDQMQAIRLLQQIDNPAATRDLAHIALFSPSPQVNQAAAQSLRQRAPREYGQWLVDLIRTPATYQYQPVAGPGTRGALIVDTPRFQLRRTYEAPPAFRLSSTFRGFAGIDQNGLPVVISGSEIDDMREGESIAGSYYRPPAHISSTLKNGLVAAADLRAAEIRTAQWIARANIEAQVVQQRMMADVNDIEVSNAQIKATNARVISILREALDAPVLGDDEDAWHLWWYEKIGYRYNPPHKMVYRENQTPLVPLAIITSCFAAGTPVRTLDGHRPIETLHVGDQVLCQDVTTGTLEFQPILVVFHNPPDKTRRVTLDNGDTVIASLFHRFWHAGKGWVMARDLEVGDTLRSLSGLSTVTTLEPGPVEPVFNLIVGKNHSYFVGNHDELVHDNTLPDPHVVPFDAQKSLAVKDPGTRGTMDRVRAMTTILDTFH